RAHVLGMAERPSTDVWGIDDRYFDVMEGEHVLSPEGRAALLAAMGVATDAPYPPPDAGPYEDVVVLRGDSDPAHTAPRWTAPEAGELRLEDGSRRPVAAGEVLAATHGYHDLRLGRRDRPTRVISCPA